MDTAQWPQVQELGLVKTMEDMVSATCSKPLTEKKARPPKDQALNCPRCNSTNTKFCYYNNYSLTQPRYFCKTCRRYWTEGGTLRNVPVGGGTRRNKRSSSSTAANSKKIPDLTPQNPPESPSQNRPKFHEVQDLNQAFRTTNDYHNISEFIGFPGSENHTLSSTSFSELLRSGISSKGLNPFMPKPVLDPNTPYPSMFGLHDSRPAFNFPLDGLGGVYNNTQGFNYEGGGKLMFPLEDVKPVPSTDFEQNRGQGDDPSGYWNGMLGGGSW